MKYKKFEVVGKDIRGALDKATEEEKINRIYPLDNQNTIIALYKSGFYNIGVCKIGEGKEEVEISKYNHSQKSIEEKIDEIEKLIGVKFE